MRLENALHSMEPGKGRKRCCRSRIPTAIVSHKYARLPSIPGTYSVVVSDPSSPQPQHAPEWDEYTEEIGDQEHTLRLEFEVLLDVPKPKGRSD